MAKLKIPRGIRMRGTKFFVDVTVNGQRMTATCDTLEEAVRKQAELRDAAETGKDVTQRRANARTWTLREALQKTQSLPKPEGWRGTSGGDVQAMNVEDSLAFMGETISLDRITRDLIDAWCHSCEAKGNSDATINHKLSALSKVMKIAVSYGGMAAMPTMPKLRKERVGRIRQVTEAEEHMLLQCFEVYGDSEMGDAVAVLIDTGMRRGELLNLRPQDVDSKTGVLVIAGTDGKGTKNGEIRSVPMTKRVRQIMYKRKLGARCFNLTEPHMRHAWDRARAHMGLVEDEDFVLHALRHTCCSRLVRKGVPLPVVQKWMGHKNIQTTMRYAHLMPTDLMSAVTALEGDAA